MLQNFMTSLSTLFFGGGNYSALGNLTHVRYDNITSDGAYVVDGTVYTNGTLMSNGTFYTNGTYFSNNGTYSAMGAESLPRGTHVRVRVTGADLLTLDLHASVLARLDDDTASEAGTDDAADDSTDTAGPLTLAIDIDGEATQEAEAAAPVASA